MNPRPTIRNFRDLDDVAAMGLTADELETAAGAQAKANAAQAAAEAASIPSAQKGAAGGVAELDAAGVVPSAQLRDDLKVGFRAGAYLSVLGSVSGGDAIVQGKAYAVPLPRIQRTQTFDRIGLEVTTLQAGQVIRLGVFEDTDLDMFPDTRVLDAGTIDAGSTGFKEIVIAQQLEPGVYFAVAVAQGGGSNPSVRDFVQPVISLLTATSALPVGGRFPTCYSMNGVTGALPAAWDATIASEIIAPAIRLRAA